MVKEVKFIVDQGYAGGEETEIFKYNTDDYESIKTMEEEIQEDYEIWRDERLTNLWVYTDEED